jgi:hypothetical protein
MEWTIATAGTVNAVNGKTFTKAESNHPKWTFAASVDTAGQCVKITPVRKTPGTMILVR